MTQSTDLLRMLEPTVRPTGTPAPAASGRPAFDQVDFAQILQQAQTGQGPVAQQVVSQAVSSGQAYLEEAAKAILGLDQMASPEAAEEIDAVEGDGQGDNENPMSFLLGQLGQVNKIENESLRQALGQNT